MLRPLGCSEREVMQEKPWLVTKGFDGCHLLIVIQSRQIDFFLVCIELLRTYSETRVSPSWLGKHRKELRDNMTECMRA